MSDLYKDSGVDTNLGDATADWLKSRSDGKNSSPVGEVVSGIGGFAGLFRPNFKNFQQPLLVAATDGVGTKLMLAAAHNRLDVLGFDLVAMCVNDLYCVGAEPMFFLDYYVTGKLDPDQFKTVLASISEALASCNCPLLGGETAEHPGHFAPGDFDLAGFVVGVVDEANLIGAGRVKRGDVLFTLPSSGFHSNGFSLIRSWIKNKPVSDETITKFLTPTMIYADLPEILREMRGGIHALANITGGGISGNLIRILPEGLTAQLDQSAIPTPEWMREFITSNGASFIEAEGALNMGCGMVAAVNSEDADRFQATCEKRGLSPKLVGEVTAGERSVVYR